MSGYHTMWIRFKAPFASFRWMQAGSYRATSTVIPPSTAYGLVCNLGSIETKLEAPPRPGVLQMRPKMELMIGSLRDSNVAAIYHQAHHYLVGNAGKHLAERCAGAKYWIAPTTMEHVVDFECIVGVRMVDTDGPIFTRIARGIRGQLEDVERYGIPNAGSSNYFFETIELLTQPLPATFYTPLRRGELPNPGTVQLSVNVDHKDSSKTSYWMFSPSSSPVMPPSNGWVSVGTGEVPKASSNRKDSKARKPTKGSSSSSASSKPKKSAKPKS